MSVLLFCQVAPFADVWLNEVSANFSPHEFSQFSATPIITIAISENLAEGYVSGLQAVSAIIDPTPVTETLRFVPGQKAILQLRNIFDSELVMGFAKPNITSLQPASHKRTR